MRKWRRKCIVQHNWRCSSLVEWNFEPYIFLVVGQLVPQPLVYEPVVENVDDDDGDDDDDGAEEHAVFEGTGVVADEPAEHILLANRDDACHELNDSADNAIADPHMVVKAHILEVFVAVAGGDGLYDRLQYHWNAS